MTFGERIKEALKINGYQHQKHFCDKYGYNYKTFNNWITTDRCPSYEKVIKLAKNLSVTTDWLLGGEENNIKDAQNSYNTKVKQAPFSTTEKFKIWLDETLAGAPRDKKIWLEYELKRHFPEFRDWLEKKESDPDGSDTSLQANNNT